VSGWLPHGARGRNLLYNLSLDEADRYIDSIALFSAMTKRTLYQEDFGQSLEPRRPERLFRDIADASGCDDTLDCQLYLDTRTYLPGDILTKVDRMSMAASLETRAPLLDQELIEFVATIPPGLKLRGLETKHVLREAVRTLVPSPILTRAKQGFGVPIEHWINRQLRTRIRETLSDRRTRERGYVRQRYVDVLLDEHERGRRDHSMRLWALFVLELWHRAYCDGNGRSNVQHHPSPAPNTVSH
jgi:asparagine synthase (glutamine-hydrolysing)